jgi:hypothetical protein
MKKFFFLFFMSLLLVSFVVAGSDSQGNIWSCSDSDTNWLGNSQQPNAFGTLTYIYNGHVNTQSDSCRSNNEVNEAYCLNDWLAWKSFLCDTGRVCRDGACVFSSSDSGQGVAQACVDHDQSLSQLDPRAQLHSASYVTTTYNGHDTTWSDSCTGTSQVNEATCWNNWIKYVSYTCEGSENKCVSGACVGSNVGDVSSSAGNVIGDVISGVVTPISQSAGTALGSAVGGLFTGLGSFMTVILIIVGVFVVIFVFRRIF